MLYEVVAVDDEISLRVKPLITVAIRLRIRLRYDDTTTHSTTTEVIEITIRLRYEYDYDKTSTYRACLLQFDAIRRQQKINMSIFHRSRVVVISQSNRT